MSNTEWLKYIVSQYPAAQVRTIIKYGLIEQNKKTNQYGEIAHIVPEALELEADRIAEEITGQKFGYADLITW